MQRYAITDGQLSLPGGGDGVAALAARCGKLATDGVEFVLVREKQLPAGELAEAARGILRTVRAANPGTRVLIAHRLDVALAIGANGVNLSGAAGELRPDQVRQLMPEAFVSVSCHSVGDVERAREAGASAVLFGPVFGKWVDGVEVVAGVGLDALREACLVAGEMPVFALGGVSEENAASCVAAGASGIAGIRMFFGGRG